MPNDYLSFNGGQFFLLIPGLNARAPQPRPATGGQWTHLPYGGNKFEWDGSFAHTEWSPAGGIEITDAANYSLIAAKYGRFAPLTTPWGTFNARLAKLDVAPRSDGAYAGAVTFEWTS